ncbi:MAG TPA: Gfo/Idh/MocA family oxidoreductase [bacterium]
MDRIKVGIIGAGHLGRYHAQQYAQIPGAELIGVMDSDPAKAETVAAECQCRVFAELDRLLEAVEAVSVAVPTDRHGEVCRRVLEKDVHCLVEKPITKTVAEADTLTSLAKSRRCILHVGHVERYNPAVLGLGGFAFNPGFIEAHRLAPFNLRGTEVAVILDLMIHDIDLVLHFVGSPVERVDASGVAVVSDSVDIANARIRFRNGCVANLTASRISQKKMRKMRLFQKDAYISIDFLQKQSEVYRLEAAGEGADMVLGEIGAGENKKVVVYRRPDAPDVNSLKIELETFLRAVRGEAVHAVTGEEGRHALAVAMDILHKMEA